MVFDDSEIRQFVTDGYVVLRRAFSRELAEECREFVWKEVPSWPMHDIRCADDPYPEGLRRRSVRSDRGTRDSPGTTEETPTAPRRSTKREYRRTTLGHNCPLWKPWIDLVSAARTCSEKPKVQCTVERIDVWSAARANKRSFTDPRREALSKNSECNPISLSPDARGRSKRSENISDAADWLPESDRIGSQAVDSALSSF